MSESEGTKELSGIARSVDALFASPSPSVTDVMPDEAASLDDLTVAAEPPAVEETPEDSLDLVGGFDSAPTDEAAAPDLQVVRPDPSDPSDTIAMEDVAPSSPLEAAVDALLAGDASRTAEIERLANEMLESRDIDGVARAVGRLAAGAGDPADEDVLSVARGIATPMVYGRLARQMGSERDEERRRVNFMACRHLGPPMAVAIRDDLAESTDRLARRIHCEALVEMGPAGRAVIEEMATDENRFLVRNAVAILGDTGGERAVELVTSALANPDAKVRKEALRALAKLGDEGSGELVLGLLEDPDPEVRIAAAVAAGELHVERALRSLIKMLDETADPDEAIPLIRALGQLGDPGAVASIEKHAVPKLFSKPRTDVRIAAYRALNHIGTPHARRLLNQGMDDKNAEVKAAVKEILGMR